ncbi:hypothetical protein SARC_04984 [Sphaeroforma arctica JP610]|uniref:Pentacotripeptide-repeat region of PRORP domain-containing protein n=1 Tax=Sphaeroforma arctica JP610 TaxID=667725 RepID=A0A0L0G3H0_9EUKA|nr:hypothetical protein SARC_04984 [Sphaeroforma arctica JP610]KNC82743.1 hypothetical protein SARC_04984 [Sphaeroforma arctica JP610]|eukprot:XP_014156645.1 hypothetical protein SARC_04984 [Sphaeroforma arctica JP610]
MVSITWTASMVCAFLHTPRIRYTAEHTYHYCRPTYLSGYVRSHCRVHYSSDSLSTCDYQLISCKLSNIRKHPTRRKKNGEIKYTAPQDISVHRTPKGLPSRNSDVRTDRPKNATSIVQAVLSKAKKSHSRKSPTKLSAGQANRLVISRVNPGHMNFLEADMHLRNRTLAARDCIKAIQTFRTSRNPQLCYEVVTFATESGYELDAECYVETIEALAEVGRWKQIMKLLGVVKRHQRTVTHCMYNNAIAAFISEKQLFIALEVMRDLKSYEQGRSRSSDVQLNVAHYNQAIAIALDENKLTEALAFVNSMETNSVAPSQESWGILVAALCVIPETLPRALRYFDHMTSLKVAPQLPFRVYDTLLVACARAEYDERVLSMYSAANKYGNDSGRNKLSFTAFDGVISAYARTKQLKGAYQALEAMLSEHGGYKCNRTCKVVLQLCVSEGQWGTVQTIFTLMDDRGVSADSLLYNSMIVALSNSIQTGFQENEKLVIKARLDWILNAARTRGIKFSNHTYTTTIKALGDLGDWKRSVEMFRSLQEGFVARNESGQISLQVAYKSVIEIAGRSGQDDLRDELYLQMVRDCNLLEKYWGKFFTEGLVDLHFHTVYMAQAAVKLALVAQLSCRKASKNSPQTVEIESGTTDDIDMGASTTWEHTRDRCDCHSEMRDILALLGDNTIQSAMNFSAVLPPKFMVGHGRNSGERGPQLKCAVENLLKEADPPIRTTFEKTYATLILNQGDLHRWLMTRTK